MPKLNMIEEEDAVLFEVPVPSLAFKCDPLDGVEWGCDPIDADTVLEAVKEGRYQKEPWAVVNRRQRARPFDDAVWHAERVAWFYDHPEDGPIEAEVERFEKRMKIRLLDGNHRFAADILRGSEHCVVAVESHNVEAFLELLPEAMPLAVAPSPARSFAPAM